MRHLSRLIFAALFACLLTVSTQAEPLIVTGGETGPLRISGGTANLIGDNFNINLRLGTGNSGLNCNNCRAGDTVTARNTASDGDLYGGPARINGTEYNQVFYRGSFVRFQATFTLPIIPSDSFFEITTPFAFNGLVRGCTLPLSPNVCPASNFVFDAELTGSGTAIVTLLNSRNGYVATSAVYNFGSTQPVPEPASVLLLMSGLVGVGALARRQRKAN